MDFSNAPTPPPSPAWRRAAVGAAVIALVIYGAVLSRHVGAVAAGSDSSGYMNHARLLAAGRVHAPARTLPGLAMAEAPPFLYVPLGFKAAPNGDGLVPTYPAGFALFVLALEPLAGWRHAGDAVILLHALAGVVATFALGRMLGLGRRWATVGAAIIALSPLYLFMSLQAMSDVPSLVWTTVAVLAALRSRTRAPWALAAGAAVAIDVLLRPTSVLAFFPLAIALGGSPRRWTLFLLGGLPGAVFFGVHSMAAYGSVFTTGYGDNLLAFSAGFAPSSLLNYVRWLPVLFTPVALFVVGIPWLRGESARTRWLLASWVLVFAVFYAFYQCTHETWWYLRFLLPAAPALVVGGLLVIRGINSRVVLQAGPVRSTAVCVAALLLVAASSAWWNRRLHVSETIGDELRYGRVADWIESQAPADAIWLAKQESGSLFYYTQATFLRWDAVGKGSVDRIESAVRRSGRPLYAVLFPFEVSEEDVLHKVMPGHWILVGTVDKVTLWRRDFDTANP